MNIDLHILTINITSLDQIEKVVELVVFVLALVRLRFLQLFAWLMTVQSLLKILLLLVLLWHADEILVYETLVESLLLVVWYSLASCLECLWPLGGPILLVVWFYLRFEGALLLLNDFGELLLFFKLGDLPFLLLQQILSPMLDRNVIDSVSLPLVEYSFALVRWRVAGLNRSRLLFVLFMRIVVFREVWYSAIWLLCPLIWWMTPAFEMGISRLGVIGVFLQRRRRNPRWSRVPSILPAMRIILNLSKIVIMIVHFLLLISGKLNEVRRSMCRFMIKGYFKLCWGCWHCFKFIEGLHELISTEGVNYFIRFF